ncbi:MAG TPA: ABC transporter substrate-binding protein [Bacteroidales bacterium]|nr:ABC transporter substrate-binding protein [Bacteroidales bacterium]
MYSSNSSNLIFFLLLAFLPILLSCSHEDPAEGKAIFRYNESKGIPTLDPAFAKSQVTIWPINQLYNGLLQMDDHLNVIACIAKKWTISEDGKTYKFILRSDVFFHDHKLFPDGKGRKVVAKDFVFSLSRITDPAVASPGAWIFSALDKNEQNNSSGMKAVSDTVLEIYLKKPFPAFAGILTMQYCSVVPEEIVKHYGNDFRSNPVGTGPFYLKMWVEGEKLVMRKNPHYFEKDSSGNTLPYLDAVAITFINDKQSEFLEFIKGNLDFISGVNASNRDELITRKGKLKEKYFDKFILQTTPFLNTEYLAFLLDTSFTLVKNSPWKHKKVRKAINYGFDRKKMMTYLRNNLGTPAEAGFIPKGMPAFSENFKAYNYNPELAAKLLSEAGYPSGKGLPEILLTTTSDYLDLCEYIQHELAQIGIKIKIDVNTGATFRDMIAESKLGFFRGSWIADYPDAENYLALFYSPNFCPKGPNYTHYCNPVFDKLYEEAMLETNDSLRFELYKKMDQFITEEAVVVPLYYDMAVRFFTKRLDNFKGNPLNLLNIKTVKMKD